MLFLPSGVVAQPGERGPTRVANALSGVKLGTTLRISSHTGSTPESVDYKRFLSTGKLLQSDSTAVRLSLADVRAPALRVPSSAIDTLWVRRRLTGRGVVIGGLMSAVALSILACQPSCVESGVIFPGLLITPIPGALVGGIVGHNVWRWDRRMP